MDSKDQVPAAKIIIALFLAGVLSMTLGYWLSAKIDIAASQPAPHDLSGATFVEVRTLAGEVVMSGELRDHVDSLGNIEKDAALLGAAREQVIGEVEIEIPRRGTENRRQELEVDVISLQPHTTYVLMVDDRRTATFTTDDRGSVDVELHASIATP